MHKGGRNQTYQIKERPSAPAPIRTGPVVDKGGHNDPPTTPRPSGLVGATKPLVASVSYTFDQPPMRCPRCDDDSNEGQWARCTVHGGCVICHWSGVLEDGLISQPCNCMEGLR